ncbi:MAG: metal-dependent transcriptional regulator [Sphaerochaetaceae bacterium]|nr:metal-dependent transcriptional regulator [Sphaerochaetaceae bacterium]
MKESGEMYLETILVLSQNSEVVRSIDVARERGYSKPSVSRGLGILRDEGHIAFDNNGHITLTESGRKIAEKIYERHNVLTRLLMNAGVDEETASEDACRIEHVISDKTFDIIKAKLK